jgi:hypothetical protein
MTPANPHELPAPLATAGQLARRRLLGAALLGPLASGALLSGCAPVLPILTDDARTDTAATTLLGEAAEAHGLAAWRGVQDLAISYAGEWRALVGRLQPELTDPRYRGRSEERLLPALGLTAQRHDGPAGTKHVLRRRSLVRADDLGDIAVWLNGQPDTDPTRLDAAALVPDGYLFFLLGPLALVDASGALLPTVAALQRGGSEEIDGSVCDQLRVRLAPGLGRVATDQLVLCLDRQTRRMRRVRFTLDGLESTQGAIAEVDLADWRTLHGIQWPTRFHERLRRPIPGLPVHDWRLTGLDINRGLAAADLSGPAWSAAAARPAQPLA